MNKETKDQIAREAEDFTIEKTKRSVNSAFSAGEEQGLEAAYIAGAETWAERGEVLRDALEKVRKYFPDTTAHAQDIDKALSNYNNHK